jgi:hypothetical protein
MGARPGHRCARAARPMATGPARHTGPPSPPPPVPERARHTGLNRPAVPDSNPGAQDLRPWWPVPSSLAPSDPAAPGARALHGPQSPRRPRFQPRRARPAPLVAGPARHTGPKRPRRSRLQPPCARPGPNCLGPLGSSPRPSHQALTPRGKWAPRIRERFCAACASKRSEMHWPPRSSVPIITPGPGVQVPRRFQRLADTQPRESSMGINLIRQAFSGRPRRSNKSNQ